MPDVEPHITYDITNSHASLYKCYGKNIPNLTGKRLWNYSNGAIWNSRLARNEYVVPVLYSTAVKIARAERALEKSGYTLKLYEGYRPKSTTTNSYTYYNSYISKNKISFNGWGSGWFLAKSLSSHNTAAAVDVTLVSATSNKEVSMPTCTAVKNNAACKLMHTAFRSAGLNELASEWWHFEERAGYERVKTATSSAGLNFAATSVVSTK